MPKPSELILALRDRLPALIARFDEIERAEETALGAQAMVDGAARESEAMSSRLETAKAKLAMAETELRTRENLLNAEAIRTLLDVNRQIAARKGELAALKGN